MKIRKIKFNNIRTKLIISLISIYVIPLIIAGYGSYSESRLILSKKLTVTSIQTLSEINDVLSDYINGFSNIVSMTSNNYDFMNVYYLTRKRTLLVLMPLLNYQFGIKLNHETKDLFNIFIMLIKNLVYMQ